MNNNFLFFGKMFSKKITVAVVFVSVIFLFVIYNTTNAITTTVAMDISSGDFGGGGLRLKQSSAIAPVARIQFGSDSNTETLTSVTVVFTGTAGTPTWSSDAATSSELLDLATTNGGITLWKETGGGPGLQSGTDAQVTLAATPVYASATSFVITPATPPTLATDEIYYIALKSDSSGVTNNNAFTFGIAADGIATSATSPTITPLTTQSITMDTVAPVVSAVGPANNSTGVPISAMVGVNFNEDMSPFSMNSSNITLTNAGGPVGTAINSFPQGFNLIISNPPTYQASSIFSKVASVVFGFFNIPPSGNFFPQGGSYVAPTLGDIVYFQHDTFPAELGIITNATLAGGTFAINNFNLFGGQGISKFVAPSATGAVTAGTSLTTGDLVVVNTTANPTGDRYAWHMVTAGAAVNNASLRLDGASGAPTYLSGSSFSSKTPTDTSAIDGTSQVLGTGGGGIDFVVGDLVFAKISAGGDNLNSYAWHIVTTAENISTDTVPTTLRLDGGASAPTFAAGSQVSKLTPGATGLVTENATAFSFGDIVLAKTTANASNNNSYAFHLVSGGATGANSTSLRFDNASSSLAPSTAYTLTIGTGVTDKAGNALASPQVVTFTTGSNSGTNTTPPFVQNSIPQMGNQNVPPNGVIKLTFSVEMSTTGGASGANSVTNPVNVGLFLDNFGAPGTAVTATNAYDSATKTVTITPSSALALNTGYVVKVNTTTQSSTGTAIGQPYFLAFRTGAALDSTALTVLGVSPAAGSIGIPRSSAITIGFSKDMDPSTITTSTITLSGGVSGTVTYNPASRSATFSPTALLAASTEYTVTVDSGANGVKDVAGNQLDLDYTSTFTTDNTTDNTKPKVAFAGADDFGIAVTFSEQVKTGAGPSAADNIANYTLESPVGSSVSLSGKTITFDGATKTARISGLTLTNGNTFKVTVANLVQDLAGNGMDTVGTPANNTAYGTVQNSTVTGGNLGPGMGTIDPAMQGMNPTRVTPMNRAAGVASNYKVEMLATTSVPLGGKIVLTFPTGFNVTNTAAVSTANSFCNADMNGPGTGAPTIASITNDNAAGTVTITTGGAATGANAFLCMDLSGIVNSSVPNSAGYSVDIKTRDTALNNLAILETKTASPFYLGQTGSGTLKVNVFKDADADGANDAGEGINDVTVFLFSPATGGQEATTANDVVNGVASFTGLTAGDYQVGIKPNAYIDVAFNSAPQNIAVAGSGITTKNFALSNAAAITISGTVTGPNGTKVDVFASSPNGFAKTTITLTGGADAYSLPVSPNSIYNVGVGPYMPESFFSPGALPPPPPTFTFMPPPNLQVNVAGVSVTGKNFALTATDKTITGTVVDSNGTGISNAGIFCRPPETSTGGTATGFGTGGQTNTSGAFTINVTPGIYICGVFKPGMPPVSDKQITVPASGDNTPASLAFVLDIASNGLTITGTVKDDSGNAIPYAGVSGRKVVSTADTTPLGGDSSNFVGGPTDANGAYTLYVSAGTWVVEAFAPGFGKLGEKTISINTSSSSGQDFSAQTLNMGTISGTVTSGGASVQGVMVRAESSGGTNGNMTPTAADGTYRLKVPAGTYTVKAFIPGQGEAAPIIGVVVTDNNTTSGQDFTIGSPITITVNVTDGTNPITNAGIDVRDANGRGNFTNVSTTSGVNAVYVINVPPGTYSVRVGHPSYGPISTTANVNSTRTITATASAGATIAVTGTVTGDAVNLGGAWVSLIGAPTGQSNSVFIGGQSASNGTFSISVPAGVYRLRVDKPGYRSPAESIITVVSSPVSAGTIALTTSDRTISGTVTLNNSGVSNAFVDATDGAGGYAVAQTDADGVYSLAVGDGTWSVFAHSQGYDGGPLSVVVNGSNRTGQTITLTAITGFIMKPEKPETVTPTSGGFLTNQDIGSNFKLNIPANALGTGSNAATVTTKQNTAMPNPPSGSILAKNAVTISAVDSAGSPVKNLNDSVTIVVPYDEANLPADTSETSLILGVYNDSTQTYDTLPTTVDTVNNTLTATVDHFSDFAPMIADGDAPATPSGLAATAGSTSQINLSWTLTSGATGYDIYRSTTSGGTFARLGSEPTISSGSTVTYSDTGLTAGTTYYYKISAWNALGESASSSEVSGRTNSASSPGGAVVIPVVPVVPTIPTAPVTSTTSATSTISTTPASSSTINSYKLGTTVLKNGSRGEAVKELQRFLNDKLNLGLVIDGQLGPKTILVIKKWQKDNGLIADGLIGPKTKAIINAGVSSPTITSSYKLGTAVLKNGSRGEAVKELQRFLNDRLNLGLIVDGQLGPKTILVIKKWQKENGLIADGLIGPKTKVKMNALSQ